MATASEPAARRTAATRKTATKKSPARKTATKKTPARKTAAAPPAGGRHPTQALLSTVPLFSGLSRSHLAHVAELAEEVEYGHGRMLMRAGAPGVAFYVIVEGEAKVVRGKIATARPEARLGPGDFFGEMALLTGSPRGASVVAETRLLTIRIERAPFRRLLKDEPDIALKLLEGMAKRMQGMTGPA